MAVRVLRSCRFLLSLGFVLFAGQMHKWVPVAVADDSGRHVVRVMSFNVRYGTADDGDDRWGLRKELVAQVIRDANADLIGTQEMLPAQAEFLQDRLADYQYVGRSRRLDNELDEQCGVFVRRQRFVILEQGWFWLSDRPEVPGSQSWDSSLPRMVTWLKLHDRASQRSIVVMNTHFDHRGQEARRRSAELIRGYATRFAQEYPLILTGDFNSAEGSDPYQVLLGPHSGEESPLRDAYRIVHSERRDDEGTFNGFRGRQSGPRIDWILISPHWQVDSAEIVRTSRDQRFPSDHFPVTAVLEY